MDYKYPNNLLIPGYGFRVNVQRTQFPRSQQFELKGNIITLADKPQPKAYGGPNTQLQSLYLRQKSVDMPPWITFDKKVLCFDAYFQEAVPMNEPTRQVRKCKIYLYLEDGTIKIIEPKVENSGIPQGTLLARQRVPLPPPSIGQFYDVIDFNIGKEIEVFGKVFEITNCDDFTRKYLIRLGITVSDPINTPTDPFLEERQKKMEMRLAKKPYRKQNDFVQLLAHDGQILTFDAFWDDRESEYGFVHHLKLYYFLADDTIEIMEITAENGKQSAGKAFLKRSKIPKHYYALPTPGHNAQKSLLSLFWVNEDKYNMLYDRRRIGCTTEEYYKQLDFAIGAAINVYGRTITLADCDKYTKEYYRTKYGLEDFAPVANPHYENPVEYIPLHQRKLPPWNGFGSYEDSAQNCITVEPKAIMRDVNKFLTLDRDGGDSRILRFRAHIVSNDPEARKRDFIICYYLVDDTISVHERLPNTCSSNLFLRKQSVVLPGQTIFGSDPPECYKPADMFVSAVLNINSFIFELVDADEYALRYMELHPNEFPKSNVTIIINKVKEKLRSSYKDFVARNILENSTTINYYKLREELCQVMGDDWTEHEMLTLGRHFRVAPKQELFTRDFIRQLVQTQIRKMLWSELDRLKEYFHKSDLYRTGYLPIKEVYTLIKGCRVPLSNDMIDRLLKVYALMKLSDYTSETLARLLNV